ncbi:LURP-one-related/scramblase family protein, partial [Streptomyces hydrogenans]|uniref:LURP-one-related/scramblase family protein n=1 Tax=Streptomyces hydrogenans TaxID=1873719 RepID=UPI0035D82BBF
MKYLVRDKLFAIDDDYWIEDEDGRHAFLVDGKALRLRDTLELKVPDGRVVITLREKLLSLRGAMTVERDERPLATVRRKRLSLLRNHYRVTMADGTELDVSGTPEPFSSAVMASIALPPSSTTRTAAPHPPG